MRPQHSDTEPALAREIWHAIVRLQRKSRLIALGIGLDSEQLTSQLSYTEGLILHILVSQPNQNLKELAAFLRLERSWMSRIVSRLQSAGYVATFVPAYDRRTKLLQITDSGLEELTQLNLARRKIVEELIADLSPKETREIKSLLQALADGLGAPRFVFTENDHPVDFELARLSWVFGVAGNDFFGSGLSVLQYQLLVLIYEQSDSPPRSIKELAADLPFDASTVSRTISAFQQDGTVQKIQSATDRRSARITLSATGRSLVESIESSGTKLIDRGLNKLAVAQQRQLAALLAKIVLEVPNKPGDSHLGDLRIVNPGTPKQRAKIEELLLQKGTDVSSRTDLSQQVLGVYVEKSLTGAIELTAEQKTGSIVELNFLGEPIPPVELIKLLKITLPDS